MEELCSACLCSGRKLDFVNESGVQELYLQIINEISLYNAPNLSVRVCWECKALLSKFQSFKEQVKRCYTELYVYLQQNTARPLAGCPRLQIHQVPSFSYPEPIKEELDEEKDYLGPPPNEYDVVVKSEETEPHCEPETFVNDLKVERKRKRSVKEKDKVKKVEKPIKEKKNRNVKIKKPKTVKKKPVEPEIPDEPCRINRTVESIIQSTVNDCYSKTAALDCQTDADCPTDADCQMDADCQSDADCVSEDFQAEDDFREEDCKKEEIKVEKVKNKVEKKPKSLNGVKKLPNLPKLPLTDPLTNKPVCGECGKTFSSRKTYRYHLNVLHKGQNRYPCPRCGKVYQWKSNLGRHMRSHKARDSGELYCDTCDKRFASVATYRQHLRISRQHVSESEFSFMCNECGKKFVNKTRLRDHIDWEHLKKIKFKCQLCNKPFKCHTSLYVHLRNVHRSSDKKDNLCHVCGKSYQNAAKLKYHIVAMHTSETPYQCQQCTAAFGWYSSLYRHVREVHYKMKGHPKKSKKCKKGEVLPSLLPGLPQQLILPQIHQPGPS